MTSFPNGHLLIREFQTLTDAHQTASLLAEESLALRLDLRLIEVSATAGGAWVCAWVSLDSASSAKDIIERLVFEVVAVDQVLMNALLSLAPKPNENLEEILILESTSIGEVLRSAGQYSAAGATVHEIRVKRSGPEPGAYAFLSADNNQSLASVKASLKPTAVRLVGDYRRFFF